MKTKLFLILGLLSSIAFESSAYKILIRGGGSSSRFYRVYIDNARAECTGSGYLSCFLLGSSAAGMERTIWHPMGEVVDFVNNQVQRGNTSGDVLYKNDLPLNWKAVEDKNIEINIKETAMKGLEKYDSQK